MLKQYVLITVIKWLCDGVDIQQEAKITRNAEFHKRDLDWKDYFVDLSTDDRIMSIQ